MKAWSVFGFFAWGPIGNLRQAIPIVHNPQQNLLCLVKILYKEMVSAAVVLQLLCCAIIRLSASSAAAEGAEAEMEHTCNRNSGMHGRAGGEGAASAAFLAHDVSPSSIVRLLHSVP